MCTKTMASGRAILLGLAVVALAAAAFVRTGHGAGEAGNNAAAFAKASGTRFTLGGRPFYSNGFNAYWLMYMASDPADRSKATAALDEAARVGAALVRTWAFSDGGYRALQLSPGVYSEEVFRVCISYRIGRRSYYLAQSILAAHATFFFLRLHMLLFFVKHNCTSYISAFRF